MIYIRYFMSRNGYLMIKFIRYENEKNEINSVQFSRKHANCMGPEVLNKSITENKSKQVRQIWVINS